MAKFFFEMKTITGFVILIFLSVTPLLSADYHDVVINEIAWMGTKTSASDEWIELYNNTDQDIDLTDWTLISVDGSPTINLSGMIPSQGYFLLERTDDNSVSNITADQIYTGALGNNGEKLQLKDETGLIIDEVDCSEGWFTGINSDTLKATMERIDPKLDGSTSENWDVNNQITRNGTDADENPINGTPKARNSVYNISSLNRSSFTPGLCKLLGNYPNPFNPSTTIQYTLSDRSISHVISLKIYNVLGQEVITLVKKAQSPGEYFVNWDGFDYRGNKVPSGVYFYQLCIGKRIIETKRMVKIE